MTKETYLLWLRENGYNAIPFYTTHSSYSPIRRKTADDILIPIASKKTNKQTQKNIHKQNKDFKEMIRLDLDFFESVKEWNGVVEKA